MKSGFLKTFLILFFAVLLGISYSCSPLSCLDETLSTVKATFYKTSTGTIVSPDSVSLYGLGMETDKIYSKTLKPQLIKIPLDAGKEKAVFILKVNSTIDTVTVVYTNYPHLISKECGFTYFHVLDTIYGTVPGVDYFIRNKNITTFNEENIRIFY